MNHGEKGRGLVPLHFSMCSLVYKLVYFYKPPEHKPLTDHLTPVLPHLFCLMCFKIKICQRDSDHLMATLFNPPKCIHSSLCPTLRRNTLLSQSLLIFILFIGLCIFSMSILLKCKSYSLLI